VVQKLTLLARRRQSAIIRRAVHRDLGSPSVMNDEVAAPVELDRPAAATIRTEAVTARARELERNRRADAARITALVQYMLHRGDDGRDVSHH
jgi:hypothetical protein